MIATNGVTRYLCEISLPNEKSIIQRQISVLQLVNKSVSIRFTPKLFLSLSKAYLNQGGAN